MAGYIGSKAVSLSTTAATVTGAADIGGDLTVDTNTLYVDATNNRVGIGASSPAYNLVVSSGGAEGIEFGPGYTSGKNLWQNYNRSTSAYVSEVHYASDYIYNVGGSERARIDSSGNVGIGATSPTAILTVQKDGDVFHAQSAASSAPRIGMFTNSSAGTVGLFASRTDTIGFPALTFATSDAERMRIDSSGRMLLNRTSTATSGIINLKIGTSDLDVGARFQALNNGNWAIAFQNSADTNVGQIVINSSSTSYNTSSDYRLKEDVRPMVGASDRVLALNPVNFAWKADGTRVDGFLAHEAQEVVPEAVHGEKDAMRTEEYEVTPAVEATYDEDGNILTEAVPAVMGTREVPAYQGIDQSKLVPLLTAALQEALNEITDLKARVAALEAV